MAAEVSSVNPGRLCLQDHGVTPMSPVYSQGGQEPNTGVFLHLATYGVHSLRLQSVVDTSSRSHMMNIMLSSCEGQSWASLSLGL